MSEIKCAVFVVVLTSLQSLTREDTEVSCVFMKSCILPCSFQGGIDAVIHWNHVTTGHMVHSYYHNQDQLAHQNQHFRGRTSLFKDQISGGNASLQLTWVEVHNEGRYKCSTSTISGNKDSFIYLNVDALVHKVNIQQVENRITCSSEGIYPEPELIWSTSPPSNVTFRSSTTVQQTELKLYNIASFLILSDSVPDLVYSCTIITPSSKRRALLRPTSLRSSDTETTIPCTSSNTSVTDLSWRFNHTEIILNQTRSDVQCRVSERWRQQVKGVSESGSLTLQDLSSNEEGIYTCELSNEEETYVTNTFLRIKKVQANSNNAGRIGGGVVAAILVVVAVAWLGLHCKKKKGNLQPQMEPKKDQHLTRTVPAATSLVEENKDSDGQEETKRAQDRLTFSTED